MSEALDQKEQNFEKSKVHVSGKQSRPLMLLGGKSWVWIVVGLAALVLIMDTFLLTGVVSLFEPPRNFLDRCTNDGSGAYESAAIAGGFALVFCALVASIFLGLCFAAPNSLWIGWVALFGIGVVIQSIIGLTGGLDGFDGYLRDRQFELFGLLDRTFSCGPDGRLKDRVPFVKEVLHARYNPVIGNVHSNTINMDFIHHLVFSIYLLTLFTVFTWTVAILRNLGGLVSRALGKNRTDVDRSKIHLWYKMNISERAIAIQGTLLTVVAFMAMPMLTILLTSNPVTTSEQVNNILWVGPLLFVIDLARLAYFYEAEVDKNETAIGSVSTERQKILPQVKAHVSTMFPEQLVLESSIGRQNTRKRAAEQSWPLPKTGTVQLHMVGMTDAHYLHFCKVLNEAVLNRGHTALVVCPAESLNVVKSELVDRFAQNPGVKIINCHLFGDTMPPDGEAIDVVFVSPESLEALLSEPEGFELFIKLLGGLVAVNLHRMDLGLLRVNLARLKPNLAKPAGLLGLFQSEERSDLEDLIRNLPLMEQKSVSVVSRTSIKNDHDHHILVLRDTGISTAPRELTKLPIGPQIMLSAAMKEDRAAVYLFDRDGRHVPSVWDTEVLPRLENLDDIRLEEWARNLDRPVLVPIDHEHPVALIEDRCNLVEALETVIARQNADEALRIVLQFEYACAGFLAAEVRQAFASAETDEAKRSALAELQKRHGALAPNPLVGGPIELAITIREEFLKQSRQRLNAGNRPGGAAADEISLRQDLLDKVWPNNDPALKQLQIRNTKGGLEKLFRLALQPEDASEMLDSKLDSDRSYSFRLLGNARNNARALSSLRLSVDEQGSSAASSRFQQRPERLLLSDYGLSYAPQTRFALGGRMYQVQGLKPSIKELNVIYREDRPAREFVFVRDYSLLGVDEDSSTLAADNHMDVQKRQIPYEVASGYVQAARRTRGSYEFKRPTSPWGENGEVPDFSAASIVSDLQLRSAAMIRFYEPNVIDLGRRVTRTALRRGANAAINETGILAFTLATTLQDVLLTCFPGNSHRLAVLAPRALIDLEAVDNDASCQFAVDRQPRLVAEAEFEQGMMPSAGVTHGLQRAQEASYLRLVDRFFELGRSNRKARPVKFAPRLELIIVEDSDHDLGVARVLCDRASFEKVLDRWVAFLEHCEKSSQSGGRFFYRFGRPETPDCYDFQSALEFVNGMKNTNG